MFLILQRVQISLPHSPLQRLISKKIKKLMAKELPAIAIPKDFHVIEDIPMMGTGKVNFREVEKICRDYIENGKKHKS